jgi:hypothetical protein
MTIEPGKFYRTRDGRKAYVHRINDGGEYPIEGKIEGGYWTEWTREGRWLNLENSPSNLVAEWTDPLEQLALLAAGKALDAAMMRLTLATTIDLYADAMLVNELHQALNAVVAVTGKPWREEHEPQCSTRKGQSCDCILLIPK